MILVYRAVRKAIEDHGEDLAAAIAYYALFSVFPLLLVVLSAAGYLLSSGVAQAQLDELVAGIFPGSSDLLTENVRAVSRVRGTLGVLGVLGLLWSGSAAFGAITRAINFTLGAESDRPLWLALLRNFLMAGAASVLVLLSLAMTAAVEVVANPNLALLERAGLEPGLLLRVSGWAASFVVVFLVFTLIYKVTPYVATRWRQILPGALLGAAVFELGKGAFLVYVERATRLEVLYGSLSSIMVLLLWLYFSAWVVILGAEYNIVRWRARTGTAHCVAPRRKMPDLPSSERLVSPQNDVGLPRQD